MARKLRKYTYTGSEGRNHWCPAHWNYLPGPRNIPRHEIGISLPKYVKERVERELLAATTKKEEDDDPSTAIRKA